MVDSSQQPGGPQETQPDAFQADWGEWIGDQHRELSLSVGTERVQLSRLGQVLIDKPLEPKTEFDAAPALPQQNGIYISTQASSFAIRDVYITVH